MSVLLLGSSMLDRYIRCEFDKIDQASPVPRGRQLDTFCHPGGAGNAYANLIAMGVPVCFVTHVGTGEGQQELLEQLDAWTARATRDAPAAYVAVHAPRDAATIIKNRVIDAQGRMVARFDSDPASPTSLDADAAAVAAIDRYWADATPDVVVISDYNKGFLTKQLVHYVIRRAKVDGIRVIADPVPQHALWYAGADWITPNEAQARAMYAGFEACDVPALAAALQMRLQVANVLITRGRHGMYLQSAEPPTTITTQGPTVVDTTGAGDAVIAGLAKAVRMGIPPYKSAQQANLAAGVVVTKPGTAVCHRSELHRAAVALEHQWKITTVEHAASIVHTVQHTQGKKVALINGCFDLLHDGHRYMLRHGHALGELLVVLVNDDASVQRAKGVGRPVQTVHERMRALAWTQEPHLIVQFGQDTPTSLLRQIRPDYVLRGEGASNPYEDQELIESWGGQIIFVPDRITSTSELVRRAGVGDGKETEPGPLDKTTTAR